MRRILDLYRRQAQKTTLFLDLVLLGVAAVVWSTFFTYNSEDYQSDLVIDWGKIKFRVDPNSAPYLQGMTIDWKTDGLNEQFTFNNPKKHTDADVESASVLDKLENIHPMKQVAYASVIQVTVLFGMFGCMAINQELIKFL